MALDFPLSPVDQQVYGNFYYDAAIGSWRNVGSKNGLSSRLTAEETLNAGLNKSGLVPIVPASVAVSSGSASVSSTGAVTFSGVNTLDILGVFSSTYRNYRLVAQTSTTSSSEWQYIQYRTASGVDSSAIYESIYYEANTTGGPGTRGTSSRHSS